jgi:hypothetical protein
MPYRAPKLKRLTQLTGEEEVTNEVRRRPHSYQQKCLSNGGGCTVGF